MEPFWVTVWFSSMALLGPATNYDVVKDAKQLQQDMNATAIMASTASVGNYLTALNTFEVGIPINITTNTVCPIMPGEFPGQEISQKTLLRVVEQNAIISGGKVIFLGTKFKAPLEWMVISRAVDDPKGAVSGWTQGPPYDLTNHFTLDQSSAALMVYTIARAAATKEKYRIYRGDEYGFKDRYDFSFKKK